jgi:signal transduction histidine kinase
VYHDEVALFQEHGSQLAASEGEQDALRSRLLEAIAIGGYLGLHTGEHLERAYQALQRLPEDPGGALVASSDELREALNEEMSAHEALLLEMKASNQWELGIMVALVLGIPLLTGGALYAFRKRIWAPLANLGSLMQHLAERDYRPVPTSGADRLLHPLLSHYNQMVDRLAELEQLERERQQDLEADVKAATGFLLAQQRALADTERLAAIGEVTASIAHELRNPIASVLLALSNLADSLHDERQRRKIELIADELRRMTRLLNELLTRGRAPPPARRWVRIQETVEAMVSVLSYQLPERIAVRVDVPAELSAWLPEDRFRQMLLNLFLNAAQSLGAEGGTLTIRAVKDGENLELGVLDDGPGFPSEILRSGVQAFGTWREKGTGLGLAMVQRFVRDMNGEMRLSNVPPHGACVTVTLPCASTDD